MFLTDIIVGENQNGNMPIKIFKDNKVIAELNSNPAKLLKELDVKYVEELHE